ncbi:MAG: hypothetical protein L3J46_06550 [Kangiellaceae bacterium]|nr:hypothetical protein [Kangiellaceae bacterium]
MSQSNLVIKQQKSQLWYVSVGLLMLLTLVGVFIVGRYLALSDLSSTKLHLQEALNELSKSKLAKEELNEKLVMQHQSSQIDSQSSKQLVNNVKELQQAQNDLESELAFYRRIMSPEQEKDGLNVDEFQISSSDIPQNFHFRLTLIQAGKQSRYLKGSVVIQVEGLLNGKKTEYDVRELGTFESKQLNFQFKYFQNIQGLIQLPGGFIAHKVSISAKTKGRGKKYNIERQFDWQPQESQNYVRQ